MISHEIAAEAVEEVGWDIIAPIKEDKLQKLPMPALKDKDVHTQRPGQSFVQTKQLLLLFGLYLPKLASATGVKEASCNKLKGKTWK